MPLRAVTLDAAGTLFDVAEPVGATYARYAATHGIALDAADADRRFRAAFSVAPPLAFPAGTDLGASERGWWYALVGRAFGPAATSPRFAACFAALFAHFGRPEAWRVFPDVPEALAQLRARGLRLGVVSNFDDRLGAIVSSLGLAPMLDAVVPSTRAGAAKPDPAIFRVALARLGASPAETLHAGDAVGADVEGARAAGLHAVLIDRAGTCPTVPPGTPVLTTLLQLHTVVNAIDTTS